METKHAPGPWFQSDSFGPDDRGTGVSNEKYLVAACTGYWGRDGAIANARLIAAAPELLEFAQLVLRGIESGHIKAKPFFDMNAIAGEDLQTQTIGGAARAVIAKAIGQS